MYDVVIIGSGPAGYVAAIRSSQLGLKTACVERLFDESGESKHGGTCLNVGCIPSKALLDSSYRYTEALNQFLDHGIKINKPKLDLSKMMERKSNIVSKLTSGVSGLLKANMVTTILGEAKVLDSKQVEVFFEGESKIINTNHVIVASGSSPIEIPVARVDRKNVVDST